MRNGTYFAYLWFVCYFIFIGIVIVAFYHFVKNKKK